MNAIDAMPQGGNLWISTRVRRMRAEIEIEVRDDGMGIPEDILPQIFEPFSPPRRAARVWVSAGHQPEHRRAP